MRAALHLMSAKGMDGVAIQDIANAAHIGFGSFYNYFPSKEAIFQTLKDELIEHDAAALDKLGEQVTDPAEKIAASARYTIRHGRANSVWGKFVLATNFNMATGSTILGGLMAKVTMSEQADDPFGSPDDLPEKVSATLLTTLGLPWSEALAIASRPLPVVDLPVNPIGARSLTLRLRSDATSTVRKTVRLFRQAPSKTPLAMNIQPFLQITHGKNVQVGVNFCLGCKLRDYRFVQRSDIIDREVHFLGNAVNSLTRISTVIRCMCHGYFNSIKCNG